MTMIKTFLLLSFVVITINFVNALSVEMSEKEIKNHGIMRWASKKNEKDCKDKKKDSKDEMQHYGNNKNKHFGNDDKEQRRESYKNLDRKDERKYNGQVKMKPYDKNEIKHNLIIFYIKKVY